MLIPAVRQPGWPDVVLAVLSLAAAVTLLVVGPREWRRMAAAAAVAAFWLASTASALAAEQTIPVAAAAMAGVAAVLILGPAESVWPLRLALGVAAAVVAVSLIYGLLTGAGVLDGAFHTRTEAYSRAVLGIPNLRGITLHPNTLGPIAAVALVVSLVAVRSSRWRPLWGLVGVSAVGLLWSQSRGSIASAAVAVASLLLVMKWDRIKPYLVAVLLLSTLTPLVISWLWSESSFVQGLITGRTLAWIPAFKVFEAFPWLGYGPDVFSREFWQLLPPPEWQPLHAHGEWPEIAAESGVLGLAALAAVALITVVTVLKRQGPNSWLLLGVLSVVCTQAAVEVPLGLTYFPISYLLPCLVVAAFAYRGDPGRIALGSRDEDRSDVNGEHPHGAASTTGTSDSIPLPDSPAGASPTPTAE